MCAICSYSVPHVVLTGQPGRQTPPTQRCGYFTAHLIGHEDKGYLREAAETEVGDRGQRKSGDLLKVSNPILADNSKGK